MTDNDCRWPQEWDTVLEGRRVERLGSKDGPNQLWRCLGDNEVLVLKKHSASAKTEREIQGLQWGQGAHWRVPKVLRQDLSHSLILMTWLEGVVVEGQSQVQELPIYREAGRSLRRLHDLPIEASNDMPLDEAWRLRLDGHEERAREAGLSRERIVAARRFVIDGLEGETKERVPCHRDFRRRNWRWSADERSLGIYDFEHARPDEFLADFLPLREEDFPGRPDLEEAFCEGYGLTLNADLERRLASLEVLRALGTWAWGQSRGDRSFCDRAEALFERHSI